MDWASLGSTRQIGKMATRIVIVIFVDFILLFKTDACAFATCPFCYCFDFCFSLRCLIFAFVVSFMLAFCFNEGCC